VPRARLEEARAVFLALFPEGFEELELGEEVELAGYDADQERGRRLGESFRGVEAAAMPDDWADRWRAFHRPARVGPLWIGPPWETPPADALAVVIDPGRAFGTGAHPTTRLCLELVLELPRGPLRDLGCGSGVLAIAAARLGHSPVVALDVDPAAVEATAANASRNGVAVESRRTDVLDDPLPETVVAVANIERGVVEQLATRVRCEYLVTSGYLSSDHPSLAGFARTRRLESDGWAADLARRV
jgi:ribosomal protein L11 methyltransferase